MSAIGDIIQGLGAGAETLGASLQEKDRQKRAMRDIVERMKMEHSYDDPWSSPFSAEDDQGPGMFQLNRQTNELRSVGAGNAMPSINDVADASQPMSAMASLIASTSGPAQQGTPATTGSGSGRLRPVAKVPTPSAPQLVKNAQGVMEPVDPQTGNSLVTGNPVTAYEAPREQPLYTIDTPEGPTYVPRPAAIGQHPKQVTHIESAMNTAAKARLAAAISEMNNADANMREFEDGLANGTRRISASAQVLGRVANAFTHDDPLSQLTQSGALSALNTTDPDLARYIRRGLSFAEGESMISQRPSDFRTKMAAFLSTAASGSGPEMVHDIQGRRGAILKPLNGMGSSGAQPAPPNGGQPPPPTHAQQLWDAAVAKHGRARVIAEYGERP